MRDKNIPMQKLEPKEPGGIIAGFYVNFIKKLFHVGILYGPSMP